MDDEQNVQPGEAAQVEILGKKLVCPVCGGDQFWERMTLLNTRGMTFFNVDFLNKRAQNEICARCGYIFWFLKDQN
jgi:ribosomal protein S27AE